MADNRRLGAEDKGMVGNAAGTTAFVLAGGGGFGAVPVGMLRELVVPHQLRIHAHNRIQP